MTDKGQNAQKTEDELHLEMQKAMREGDEAALNKLFKDDDTPSEPAKVEEPEPEPEKKDEPEDKTPNPDKEPVKEESKEPEPSPDEWEAGLDEAIKARVQALKDERNALEQKFKSEAGRVPYLQRELANYKREMSELKAKLQEPPAKSKDDKPAAPKQGSVAKKLAQLREVDPALADIFEAMQEEVINPLRDTLGNEVNQVKTMFATKEQEQSWAAEKTKLLERFPQADEIFKLPLYRDWKETLTPGQRALVDSGLADDMVVALEQFARYASVYAPELVQPAKTEEPKAPAATNKVVEDRAKKLAARAPGSPATTPKSGDGIPETEEELHEYYKKKIRAGEM